MAMAAAEALRGRILSSQYPPGFQLKQENLAREFGILASERGLRLERVATRALVRSAARSEPAPGSE